MPFAGCTCQLRSCLKLCMHTVPVRSTVICSSRCQWTDACNGGMAAPTPHMAASAPPKTHACTVPHNPTHHNVHPSVLAKLLQQLHGMDTERQGRQGGGRGRQRQQPRSTGQCNAEPSTGLCHHAVHQQPAPLRHLVGGVEARRAAAHDAKVRSGGSCGGGGGKASRRQSPRRAQQPACCGASHPWQHGASATGRKAGCSCLSRFSVVVSAGGVALEDCGRAKHTTDVSIDRSEGRRQGRQRALRGGQLRAQTAPCRGTKMTTGFDFWAVACRFRCSTGFKWHWAQRRPAGGRRHGRGRRRVATGDTEQAQRQCSLPGIGRYSHVQTCSSSCSSGSG